MFLTGSISENKNIKSLLKLKIKLIQDRDEKASHTRNL